MRRRWRRSRRSKIWKPPRKRSWRKSARSSARHLKRRRKPLTWRDNARRWRSSRGNDGDTVNSEKNKAVFTATSNDYGTHSANTTSADERNDPTETVRHNKKHPRKTKTFNQQSRYIETARRRHRIKRLCVFHRLVTSSTSDTRAKDAQFDTALLSRSNPLLATQPARFARPPRLNSCPTRVPMHNVTHRVSLKLS